MMESKATFIFEPQGHWVDVRCKEGPVEVDRHMRTVTYNSDTCREREIERRERERERERERGGRQREIEIGRMREGERERGVDIERGEERH